MRNYSNTAAATTLNGGVTDVATAWTVADGSTYPPVPFAAVCEDEVVLVTAKAGTNDVNWTVTRAYDGTTGVSHSTAATVEHAVIARDFVSNPYVLHPADKPPTTPHAKDDEFAGVSLDAKWTWRNQGTATAIVGNGRLRLNPSATAFHNWRIIEQALPATPYTVTAKMMLATPTGDFKSAGIGLNDGTKLFFPISATVDAGSGAYGKLIFSGARWTTVGAYSASGVFLIHDWRVPFYVQFSDDGTTITWRFSHNGLDWMEMGSEARATFIGTPTNIMIGANDKTNNATTYFAVEWFRVNWTPDWVA